MLETWDDRRNYIVLEDHPAAIAFAAEHWLHAAERAIQQKGRFAVALSGGSTPKAIYEKLAKETKLDWSKVWLFWSDERAVPPDHPESNYRMAMECGFKHLPIPLSQIHRMQAEKEIEKNSRNYDELIRHHLGKQLFDLVMLGVGEDGHTASLFPRTKALEATDALAVANYLPDKKTWRMTLTFSAINQSAHATLYVLGAGKQTIVPQVLEAAIESPFPASRIGTPEHKALWVLDRAAATLLN